MDNVVKVYWSESESGDRYSRPTVFFPDRKYSMHFKFASFFFFFFFFTAPSHGGLLDWSPEGPYMSSTAPDLLPP